MVPGATSRYERLMEDCAALLGSPPSAAGATQFRFRGRERDPFAEPERLTVAEPSTRFAGIDLLATLPADERADRDALAAQAAGAGVRVADDDTWSRHLQPRPGRAHRAASRRSGGRPSSTNIRRARRRWRGRSPPTRGSPSASSSMSAASSSPTRFGELTDPAEQRRRFEADMAEKERIYGERYPIDEDFLAALAAMPPASGVALGFDRLVMLATGATRIEQVIWTPVPDGTVKS